jgi:anaerobic selenocysteine-containing dehydrogenase
VIVLGSLLDNVVNRPIAQAALERASVIVVSGNGGDDLAYADVVLPVAIDHERTGTVTNYEGRITAIAAKVTAPSGSWSDIAVASELAEEFGQHLGLTDTADTARVIEELWGYPTASVLRIGHSDGVIPGVASDDRARLALDPVAFPGVRSADAVGLLARAGEVAVESVTSGSWSPSTWAELPLIPAPQIPAADAYSLRVVVAPYLYDGGVAVSATSAFDALVVASVAQVNPYDANRLGIANGDIVSFPGEGGVVRLPVSIDDAVTKGTVVVPFGAEGVDGEDVAATWRVGSSVLTEVRMESR